MSDLAEIKDLVQKQGTAWEEFKRTNDERISAIEAKGYAPADLTEKVEVINTDLSKLGKDLDEVMKKANRPQAGEGDGVTAEMTEYRQGLNRWMRKGNDAGLADLQRKAMNNYSDPDGGYLVDEVMDQAIDRIVPTISAMAGLARNVTIAGPSYKKLVKKSGMSMAWVADGATNGETTEPTYAEIEIPVFEGEVEPWVFNTTLEDAMIDLETDLTMEAGIGFGEGLGSAYIIGDGVGKPRGITKYTNVANASYAWGKVGYIASGKSAAFASSAPADKIIDLQHALKQQYRPGANFVMADATLGTARQMKDGSGTYYLWQPDPLVGFGGRFLGSPVVVDDNMPAIAANSYSIAFGNFQRAYTIVNRRGTALIRDNITAKGKTKFNFRRRGGGGIVNFEAVKLMKFATS